MTTSVEKPCGPPILNALFGCFLTGSVFAFAFFTAKNPPRDVNWITLLGQVGIGHLAFIVVAGALIHALHKGVLVVPIRWLRGRVAKGSVGGGVSCDLLYTSAWAYLLGEGLWSHTEGRALPGGWFWFPLIALAAAFFADCRKPAGAEKA